jgi:hypothetical protein
MFKKIDVFYNGHYLHSTNSYKTCREAKQAAINYYLKSQEPGSDPLIRNSWKEKIPYFAEFKFKALFDHNAKN